MIVIVHGSRYCLGLPRNEEMIIAILRVYYNTLVVHADFFRTIAAKPDELEANVSS